MKLPALIKDRLIQRNFDYLQQYLNRDYSAVIQMANPPVIQSQSGGITAAFVALGQMDLTFSRPATTVNDMHFDITPYDNVARHCSGLPITANPAVLRVYAFNAANAAADLVVSVRVRLMK